MALATPINSQILRTEIWPLSVSTNSTNACPTTSFPIPCTFLALPLAVLDNDFQSVNGIPLNQTPALFRMNIVSPPADEVDVFRQFYTTSSMFLID